MKEPIRTCWWPRNSPPRPYRDAARASKDSADEFDLVAAMAARLAFAPAVHNAQMNIQVHGGIGFTWEPDAHLFLAVPSCSTGCWAHPADAEDVTEHAARGTREVSLDLPVAAEAIRARYGSRQSRSARWRAPNNARRWWSRG